MSVSQASDMVKVCRICRGPASADECYIRFEGGDRPACRPCWELLLLDPRKVLRTLQSPPLDRTPPAFPALRG